MHILGAFPVQSSDCVSSSVLTLYFQHFLLDLPMSRDPQNAFELMNTMKMTLLDFEHKDVPLI